VDTVRLVSLIYNLRITRFLSHQHPLFQPWPSRIPDFDSWINWPRACVRGKTMAWFCSGLEWAFPLVLLVITDSYCHGLITSGYKRWHDTRAHGRLCQNLSRLSKFYLPVWLRPYYWLLPVPRYGAYGGIGGWRARDVSVAGSQSSHGWFFCSPANSADHFLLQANSKHGFPEPTSTEFVKTHRRSFGLFNFSVQTI